MTPDRYRTTEFLARVRALLTEAQATRATLAQTDRLITRELVARREEMLKTLCGGGLTDSAIAGVTTQMQPSTGAQPCSDTESSAPSSSCSSSCGL